MAQTETAVLSDPLSAVDIDSEAAQKSLYALQPLPQKIERVHTRTWSQIKSGS